MAEHHYNGASNGNVFAAFRSNAFRPPALPQQTHGHRLALSDKEPIDQFIQTGGGEYYPSSFPGAPSDRDYFSLFAEFAMDLTPASCLKTGLQQQPPPLGHAKTDFAPPTYSTTVVPQEALNNSSSSKNTNKRKEATKVAAASQQKVTTKKARMAPHLEDDEATGNDSDSLPERERRLLKNRKAAQQFRKRQKSHILELEAHVEVLSAENSSLTSQVGLLQTENKLIREQLDYMRSFVLNALQFSFPPNMPLQEVQKTIMPLTLSSSPHDKDGSPSSQHP